MGASQRLATVVAIGLVIVATFSVVYLFNEPDRRDTAAADKLHESALIGVETYVANCLVCHGPDGKAEGRQGIPLNTDQNQVTGANWDLREPVIRRTIERGRGQVMPAWAQSEDGPLNDQQITGLVNMIHLGYWDEVEKEAKAANGGQLPTPPPLPTAAGGTPEDPAAAAGQQLATDNGCVACHTVDGTDATGPTWKGLFGHEVKLADGSTVTADEAYITESIHDPSANVVEGFSDIMPKTYANMSQEDVDAIIAYIKSLSE
ncbi:MAG TPA: c-type cytochrome [Thermomicrobiales bacterium]|nr:c-type cytochrome [Thermomicrobiales bacterium]